MMKAFGIIVILFLVSLGMKRAFFVSALSEEVLSTRQKIELSYRNAMALPLNDKAINLAETEITELVKKDPFLLKRDRLWVKEKLKSLRSDNAVPLAMGFVR